MRKISIQHPVLPEKIVQFAVPPLLDPVLVLLELEREMNESFNYNRDKPLVFLTGEKPLCAINTRVFEGMTLDDGRIVPDSSKKFMEVDALPEKPNAENAQAKAILEKFPSWAYTWASEIGL